ncbi:DUF805 domain-containing protein [Acidipropionibacterium virtanenii]|uniref:Inner membrane protein YhaI n=1 Tax=Acidipropionibacterium virtanenii TaxID=2057246 RepID=A0A344UTK7_9ACTN|nr:DUF805 domain-containing protein [Acidipropionibacterium virtanenii]AXE38605.1 Inner membrane protein YhaI [Acidipropionibacterium virtanenii]
MSTPQPPAGDPYGQVPGDPYGQNSFGQTQGGRPRPSVNFSQAIQLFFKNYAVFNGRASRSEFWWVMLFTWLVNVVLNGIGRAAGDSGSTALMSLSGLWSLAILVPSLAIAWRRLHDTGRSGGWFFINFIPFVGTIIFIVLTASPSNPAAWQQYDNGKLPAES